MILTVLMFNCSLWIVMAHTMEQSAVNQFVSPLHHIRVTRVNICVFPWHQLTVTNTNSQSVCLYNTSHDSNESTYARYPGTSSLQQTQTVHQCVSTLHHMTVTTGNIRTLPRHQLTATNTNCPTVCLYTTSHDSNDSQHTHVTPAPAYCNKHKLSISVSLHYIT